MKTKISFKVTAFTIFVFFISVFPLTKLIAKPDASAQAVDLVDLKKKEEKRKKKAKKSKYVVTNQNIDKIKVPKKTYGFIKVESKDGKAKSLNDQTLSGEAGTNQKAGGEGASTAGPASEKDKRAYWQEQMRNLLISIDDLKKQINQNQAELNRWELNWSAIDDPIKEKEMREKVKELRVLIPQQQKDLAELQKKKEDLELRARKERIPPGWLRIDDLDKKPPPKKDKEKDKENKEGDG